jgi:proliferating cell nuclear antigen
VVINGGKIKIEPLNNRSFFISFKNFRHHYKDKVHMDLHIISLMVLIGEAGKMFHAKVKANVLKDVIDVTSPLVNEVKFNISKDAISLRAVDPAHVAMVDLLLKKDAFEEYNAEEIELGVDMDKFGSIMRLASSNDVVSLDFDQKQNRLVIQIGNLIRRMALIDTAGMPDPKMPNLELPGKVVIKASELNQGVKASESISDHLALTMKKDSFELFAEGDTDTVNLTLGKDMVLELTSNGKLKSLFSIDYFSNMIKTVKADEPVTIFLGNDNPTKVEFDVANNHGHVTYLLAPRIESE